MPCLVKMSAPHGEFAAITNTGFIPALQETHICDIAEVTLDEHLDTDVEAQFGAARVIASIAASREKGAFLLLVAGNCSATLGTVSGISVNRNLGMIWLDAHGDFHTPETTTSGFLDGMGLATIAGRCWKNMAASVPGFVPMEESCILHIGGRAFEEAEIDSIADSEMQFLTAAQCLAETGDSEIEQALSVLILRGVRDVYVHLDLDVLDPTVARANRYAAPNGFTVEFVRELITRIHSRFNIIGATLSSYDPSADPEGKAANAAVLFAKAFIRNAHSAG